MELISLSCSSSLASCSSGSLKWKLDKKSCELGRRTNLVRHKSRRGNSRGICISSYVADGDASLSGSAVDKAGPLPKVLIPSLPEKTGGGRRSSPVRITSSYWEWKPNLTVHYEKAGMENIESPPILFLPGFGVGSFHYEKQLKDLGRDYRLWALDFLGQGRSLPLENPTLLSGTGHLEEDEEEEENNNNNMVWGFGEETEPWAEDLVYSMDLWRDQVQNFVEKVVGEPVYLVGNSLGGFVALYFAACNPDLVKGVTLLNATPFWGLVPNPARSPGLAKLFPWAGTFPLPKKVRKLTEAVWEKVSEPESISEILKQVYADHSTNVDDVFTRIVETTQHPAAPASFASIMFAPKARMSFQESLTRCKSQDIPICLMYGKEDPWVRTIWGLKVKEQVPEAPYYEISPAGHCPHDEVPEVINYLLRGWIKNIESEGLFSLPLTEDPESLPYDISREVEFLREGTQKSVKVHVYGSNISIWNRIGRYLKSHATELAERLIR